MSRKDYVLIAGIIKQLFHEKAESQVLDKKTVAIYFAVKLSLENQAFNGEKFIKACLE